MACPLRVTFALVCAHALPAQDWTEPPRRDAGIGRVAESDAPRIDGDLGDACWTAAPAIGEFTMVEPFVREPTQRTVVKVLHDRHHLYFGIWCFDRDPANIRATQRARDARLDPDDRVEILLDPFQNRRTAYFFQIGAGGSIGDILIAANGASFDKPWDTIWSGSSRVTADGWFAEIAIPFRSLPRPAAATTWGFNMTRHVRASNEEYRWTNASQSTSFFRISQLGTLTGFGEVDAGLGVTLVPYVAGRVARDRAATDDDWDVDPDAGGELYWRPSPAITLATTVFTDFAETEVDDRQINLNRFPLFFPEKRDFFLEGSSYFGFGASEAGDSTFLPFFTRRIGLASDGTQIPLLFGAKLTGEVGPFEFGVLDVQTDRASAVDRENLAVGRFRYALGEQTTVGLLGTHGDPASLGENRVGGVDFYHRVPQLVGDLDLTATLDIVRSSGTAGDDDDSSFGADLRARGSEWTIAAGVRQVGADFRPALGFVPRRDTRRTAIEIDHSPRLAEGGPFRKWLFGLDASRADAVGGAEQEAEVTVSAGFGTHAGDEIYGYTSRAFERVDADFTLFRGTTPVPAGDYHATRFGAVAETSEGRPWNGIFTASTGDFFDGRSDQAAGTVEWRTSPLLHVGAGYETALVDLGPGRAFTTHIASGRFDLHLSSAVSVRNLVQFDNESNLLGWQSRLRWIYAPGCDFFAVLGTAWERDEGSLIPTEQALELKLAHALRF